MVFSSWFASRRSAQKARCRPILEALEDRTVPALTLGTALSVGHELGSSNATDVVVDSAGNSYMTGAFSGMTDFDSNHTYPGDTDILTARGSADIYVAKYAPDSSLIWVTRMGGDTVAPGGTDSGKEVCIDGSGNVYLTGEFFGSADFGSVTLVSASGDRDGFVAKLNPSGTVQWANRWGATGDDFGGGVGVDAAGNVYTLGLRYYADTYDVYKFKPSGVSVWTQSIFTKGRYGATLKVDSTGSVFVGGDFHGLVDFDPSNKTYYASSSVSYTSYSGFVLKLTNAGKFAWVSPFVGQGNSSLHGFSYIMSIVLDGSGNVIVGGGYNGPVDFNPGAGASILPTGGRAFITKLNSNGGLTWAKPLESDNTTFVYGLAVDAVSSIYATGSFYGMVDFDPGVGTTSRTTAGGSDIFVMKLTSSGNFGWVETFGDTGNDNSSGIAVDPSGTIHLAGSYRGAVDFDPTDIYFLSNPGPYSNMFLVRLRQS